MKYLIVTGIFALGLSLGYVVGTQSAADTKSTDFIAEQNLDSSNEEISYENDEHDKPAADTNLDLDSLTNDSLDFSLNDTILYDSMSDSLNYLNDEDLSISREKLIRTVKLAITYLSEDVVKDTSMQDALGIDEVQAKFTYLEFWESPLNFEGYKLSKKKIIVYGLSPQFDYKLYKNQGNYYFAYHNVYYKMKETQDFLPFVEVSKSEVFND